MELDHAGFGIVVSLFKKARPLNFPAVAQVDAYWEGLRAGRIMPDRAEVDPRGLGSALHHAFLLEQIAPGVGRIRVSGQHLRDLLGMEVRGMPVTALFLPEARDRIAGVLESVVATPQVADVTLRSPASIGQPALAARLFLGPLASRAHLKPRLLGCLETQGTLGRLPRRFDIERVQLRRIVPTVGTGGKPAPHRPPATQPSHGFSEPSAEFGKLSTAPRGGGGKPYLRLVKNDE